MSNRTGNIVKNILCALLLLCTVVVITLNRSLTQRVNTLEEKLKDYKEKENHSFVIQRISEQMEDIAYQQKDISDQQREAAIFQMSVADSMRVRAEQEENKAKAEQRKAQQYALHLEEAKNVAESQRQLAVKQQQLAEHAKNVADTLNYLSLARSLASNSELQYQSGDKALSALLAYMSWAVTSKFHGNVFYPSIFNALSINSKAFLSKKIHQGGVTKIIPNSDSNSYISVSKYGEICSWSYHSGEFTHQMLFNDATYDFRDIQLDTSDRIFALSNNAQLVEILPDGSSSTVLLPKDKQWKEMDNIDDNTLLLVSTRELYLYNKTTHQITQNIPLDDEFSAMGTKEGNYLVFYQNGKGSKLQGNTLTPLSFSIPNEKVTSYTWLPEQQIAAAGTASGNIYILDHKHQIKEKLVGHRSRITHLAFAGHFLYSSSYDCSLNLWDLDISKKEALTLTTLPSWIYTFSYSNDNSIWIGDESGTISRILTSPDDMGMLVKRNLERDFTDAEWEYYFGSNTPHTSLILEK